MYRLIAGLLIVTAGFAGFFLARSFVRRRLRFVDAIYSPAAPGSQECWLPFRCGLSRCFPGQRYHRSDLRPWCRVGNPLRCEGAEAGRGWCDRKSSVLGNGLSSCMSTVLCTRCGQERDQLAFRPFQNDLGLRVYEQICNVCWQEWLKPSSSSSITTV